MTYAIPGFGNIEIKTLILDLNGTISIDGKIIEGVRPRVNKLKQMGFRLVTFSGNLHGNAEYVAEDLGIDSITAQTPLEKESEANKLDPQTCAAIGNGMSDELIIRTAKVGVVVLQSEGVHTKALLASDIIVPNINDALDLFIFEDRLISTMRS